MPPPHGEVTPAVPAHDRADVAAQHALAACLIRERVGQVRDAPGAVHLALPRTGRVLRIGVRRWSATGGHRLAGAVHERRGAGWQPLDALSLAGVAGRELAVATGTGNDDFAEEVIAGRRVLAAILAGPGPGSGDPYLRSEQSLSLGHRFHPTPKTRPSPVGDGLAWAPELGVRFRLHHVGVRDDLVRRISTGPRGDLLLRGLSGRTAPPGWTCVPVHPWQWLLTRDAAHIRAALADGRLLDLGPGGPEVTPTSSVRTVLHPGIDAFVKLSLDVRITNCVRRLGASDLHGAVALSRLLDGARADLAERHPGTVLLAEPAALWVDLGGPPGTAAREEFGLVVREGVSRHAGDGGTALLAAAVAARQVDADAFGPLPAGAAGTRHLLRWWQRYLDLLVPSVLDLWARHGVVVEAHVQNVVAVVGPDRLPARLLLRDLEGAKIVEGHAVLPAGPHGPPTATVTAHVTYDPVRAWHRLAYCLLTNNAVEVLEALADLRPGLSRVLWARLRASLDACARALGRPPQLLALLAGAPLPGKANLRTRWSQLPDPVAGYVDVPHPLASWW